MPKSQTPRGNFVKETIDGGWTLEMRRRPKSNIFDRYWYSPLTNKKFRSRVEVDLFKSILAEVGESNEDEAYGVFQQRRGNKKRSLKSPPGSSIKKKKKHEKDSSLNSSNSSNSSSSSITKKYPRKQRKTRKNNIREAKQSNACGNIDSTRVRRQCASALVKLFEQSELDATTKQLPPTSAYMYDISSEPKTGEIIRRKMSKSSDPLWLKNFEMHKKSNEAKFSAKKSVESKSEKVVDASMMMKNETTGMPAIAESKV